MVSFCCNSLRNIVALVVAFLLLLLVAPASADRRSVSQAAATALEKDRLRMSTNVVHGVANVTSLGDVVRVFQANQLFKYADDFASTITKLDKSREFLVEGIQRTQNAQDKIKQDIKDLQISIGEHTSKKQDVDDELQTIQDGVLKIGDEIGNAHGEAKRLLGDHKSPQKEVVVENVAIDSSNS
mmetsp:Transcript_95194/g.188591  ORF Transcript_95194/g.188591 Transcript_95194/m.188591 type:complete len:184 (+) Transcript_95194:68-619(+)